MRLVIKIGTSLLSDKDNFLDRSFLQDIVAQIAELHRAGHQIVVVSSGAVASGRTKLEFARAKKNIPYRQALAAVGQGVLLEAYTHFLAEHKVVAAQALLTNFDFIRRENFLNTKNVFEVLLAKKVIPIVNENDVTTIAELKFGDNDMLSAKTAGMVSADYLIVLTDVDGLFAKDPKKNPNAKLIPVVAKIDGAIKKSAEGTRSASSLGGMITKLEAAEYVTSIGISMVIAHGRRKDILKSVADGLLKNGKIPGTLFRAEKNPLERQKKWLRPQIKKNAAIMVDSGAATALLDSGKSLLPSGIIGIEGSFNRGDVVMVKSQGKDLAYGQVNYDSEDLDKIKKHHSREIEAILGFSFEDEIIHRDRMVVQP